MQGASIIQMLKSYLGNAAFQSGLQVSFASLSVSLFSSSVFICTFSLFSSFISNSFFLSVLVRITSKHISLEMPKQLSCGLPLIIIRLDTVSLSDLVLRVVTI